MIVQSGGKRNMMKCDLQECTASRSPAARKCREGSIIGDSGE